MRHQPGGGGQFGWFLWKPRGTSKEMELCSILTRQNLDKAAKPTGVCLPFSVVFEVEQWHAECEWGHNYRAEL